MKELRLPYPSFLDQTFHLTPERMAAHIMLMAALKMYEVGELSFGDAAAVAQLPHAEFLAACRRYRVSVTAAEVDTPLKGLTLSDRLSAVSADKPPHGLGGEPEGGQSSPLPAVTPADRIPPLLWHPEALELIELLESQELEVVLEKPAMLQLFAGLVAEGVVAVEEGRLIVTPMGERQIEHLVHLEYARWLE